MPGRLRRYGYPEDNRIIEIQYPPAMLDGAVDLPANHPVVVTDAAGMRQLEFYFDDNHHVAHSVLRDLSRSDSGAACLVEATCFQTNYIYENGPFG